MATAEGSQAAPTDNVGEKPVLLLYNYTYSYYGQKVVLVLHEKGVPFNSHAVNLMNGEQVQGWYLKLNPKGEVPVLKDGETVISDSARIINYLEDKYNSEEEIPRLLPSGEDLEVTGKHTHFTTILRDLAIPVLTYGSFYHTEFTRSPKLPFILPVRRHMKATLDKKSIKLKQLAEKNPEMAEVLLEKAEKAEKFRETILDKGAYEELLKKIEEVLDEVETQLASNQGEENWLVSKQFSVADVELTILLERLYLLGLEERFWGGGKKPNLVKYYAKVKQRDSYKKTMPTLMFHIKTLLHGLTFMSL